jgi:uncharacterized protein YndB with AHSA1/START domain
MSPQTSEHAIRKSVVVRRSVEEAFRIFTADVAGWWPVRTHSVEQHDAETVVLEPRHGGRFYEIARDGNEHLWGTVLVWEPPRRLVYSWHPGRSDDSAQEVEVVFEPHEEGTQVSLVHTGWEKRGPAMAEAMASYDEGWDMVLGLYAEAAGAKRS